MNRIYIMPVIGGGGPDKGQTPAYGSDLPGGMLVYGATDICVAILDVTAAQHAEITLNADVLAAPADIDAQIGAVAVTTIQTFLESIDIPSHWINTSMTYRAVIRKVCHIFYLAIRYSQIAGKTKLTAGNMNTQWRNLSAQTRANIRATGDSLGIDYSGVQATDSIKVIIKSLSDFWAQPVTIYGVHI